MAEQAVNLNYIIDPFEQFMNLNGKPLVGGYITLYLAGTDEKYISYQNFDYTQNPFKVPINSDGRVTIIVDDSQTYDAYVYSSNGNLVVSRLNLSCAGAGGGLKEVLHDGTMTGKGTQLSPLGISQLTNLAVDDTMTAYSATIEGKDSLVLGVNGDWFYNEFGSAFSGKLDTSSFNSAYVGLKGDLSSKVDWSAMTSYYDKDETYNIFMPRSAIDLNNYYTKNETYNKEEITSFLDRKQDKLTFGYNEYNEINSINNSAIAGGQGGSSGDETPWISAADIISAIGYIQPGQTIQALSSIDVSGNKNHFIGMKGSKFIFPTVDMLSAWLDLSGVMAQSSFDNFYSAGYQPAINDLYNSANFNTTNKLDISSFNDWSAAYAPTTPSYEVSAGNWIDVVADDVEHVKVVSVTGLEEVISGVSATLDNKIDEVSSTLTNEFSSFSSTITGDLTGKKDKQSYTTFTAEEGQFITGLEQDTNGEIVSASFGGYSDLSPAISSTEIIGSTKPMSGDMLIQVLSSISLSGDKNHGIIMEGSVYRFPNNNELASGINQTNTFLTQSAFSSYSNAITDNLSILYGQDNYLSGRIDNLSGVLKSTSSTVNSNSGNWGKAYTATTANSGKWTSVYNTVNSNSGKWNNKLDTSAFTAYTAQADESFVLLPGTGIALSSDIAQSTTTIWFTGDAGDTQVNNVVRTNSATWNGKLDANALSAGEGIAITSANGKQVITNNISAGENISLVYDSESNKIRIDCDVTGDVGHTYSGIAPILVDNVNDEISISGESLSAGPGIDMFSSGDYVVISASGSNCHCIKFTNTLTSVDLANYSAYDKVTVVNAQQYGTNCELYWDGNTKVFPSGLYCELVRGTKSDNSDKWSFMTSGWTNDNWWDYN